MDKILPTPSPIILTQIPIDTLLQSFREIIRQEIAAEQSSHKEEKLLCTNDVCKLLSVSSVTISTWIAKGKLKKYTIGGRNRFKYSEIMQSLTSLKKYSTV